MTQNTKQAFDKLKKRMEALESAVLSLKKTLETFEEEIINTDFTQVEGVMGIYDGTHMVAPDGSKYEVPANYAAKSKIVFGDTLKLVDTDGKKLFKHVGKVERLKVEGILTKKEGEWYILTDRGSYKVLDSAAEYQRAELNSEATAFIPTNDPDVPFATLDVVQGFGPEKPVESAKSSPRPKSDKPHTMAPKGKPASQAKRSPIHSQAPKKPKEEPAVEAEITTPSTIVIEDDDLV